jgi:hypothetical protein
LPIWNELCAIGKLVLLGTRIVLPTILREHVLELAHEGHPGISSMKIRLMSKVWWPGIDKSIERYCKSCYVCQLVSQPSTPEPMTRTEFPSKPWQHICLDLCLANITYLLLLIITAIILRWLLQKQLRPRKLLHLFRACGHRGVVRW